MQSADGTRVRGLASPGQLLDRVPPDRLAVRSPNPQVFVVSDVLLYREGLTLGLAQDGSVDVVGGAEAVDAPTAIAELCPDAVLLDAGLADGLALPRLLKTLVPGVQVVVFAVDDSDADVLPWAEAGASGYVGRGGSTSELIAAIHCSARGELACPPRLAALLFGRVAELSVRPPAADAATAAALTPREREVMTLVDKGLANKAIARHLHIGHATVKNHVHRVLEKLRLHSRAEAAARLRREHA